MALRALLRSSEQSGSDARGTAEILLNRRKVVTLEINKENNDLFHQFVLPKMSADRDNEIEIRFSGEGGLAYQDRRALLCSMAASDNARATGTRSEI